MPVEGKDTGEKNGMEAKCYDLDAGIVSLFVADQKWRG